MVARQAILIDGDRRHFVHVLKESPCGFRVATIELGAPVKSERANLEFAGQICAVAIVASGKEGRRTWFDLKREDSLE